jgi:transcriptional regulator with XRE-family HTH domain
LRCIKILNKSTFILEISKYMELFLGQNIRYLRKYHKMTLVELSEKAEISKSALSDYETCKSVPGLDVLQKFSDIFNISISHLHNSDIPSLIKKGVLTHEAGGTDAAVLLSKLDVENDRYIFNIELLNQRLEGLMVQMQLLKQLLDSKEAENKTLKINIRLLEEKIKNI